MKADSLCPQCGESTWDDPAHECPPEWVIIVEVGDNTERPPHDYEGQQYTKRSFSPEHAIEWAVTNHFSEDELGEMVSSGESILVWARPPFSKTWLPFRVWPELTISLRVERSK